MIKSYVIIYLLFAFHMMTFISCNSAEVIWDDSNDVIYYEGKLYYPSDKTIAKNFTSNSDSNSHYLDNDKNSNKEAKNKLPEKIPFVHEPHEEKLATGGKFWFCCFMILSNFFSINNFKL